MFFNNKQIGFICFANYTPKVKNKKLILHSNRVVIHPDFIGFGLGIKLTNITASYLKNKNFDIRCKLSALPLVKGKLKYPELWRLLEKKQQIKKLKAGGNMHNKTSFRQKVTTYIFKYIGN